MNKSFGQLSQSPNFSNWKGREKAMAIKDEIQGPKGYMKKVRDNYLGATREMANAAFEKYEKETGLKLTKENILKDIDGTLRALLITETAIYN